MLQHAAAAEGSLANGPETVRQPDFAQPVAVFKQSARKLLDGVVDDDARHVPRYVYAQFVEEGFVGGGVLGHGRFLLSDTRQCVKFQL